MKKYFSIIRTLAALLMAGAAFTACSSDDNISEQPANPTAPKTYTFTVNATKDASATTRALDLDEGKLVAKWAEGDELYVFKAENRADCTPANLLGTISVVAGSLSADGKSATFTGTLTGTVSDDALLMLVYHPAAFAVTGFEAQAGTLASASALDCATASVTASVSGSAITISETSATFTTHTAMLKLTLTTDGTTTINPTSLKMSMSAGGTPLYEFTFTPTAATYTANGDGVFYCALPSAADVAAGLSTTTDALAAATITYAATVGSDTYTATKTGYTFAAGKYYAGTLTMALAPSYTMAAAATTSDKGKLICTAGHIHVYGEDAACTAGRVAKIIYVGPTGHATYNHGLALALEDMSTLLTWDNSGANNGGNTAAEWCSAWNTSKPVTDAEWLLASKDQWNYMLGTSGAGSSTTLLDGFTSVGGSNLESQDYWSSTEYEYDPTEAWMFNFGYDCWYDTPKNRVYPLVRACLAF